MADPLPWPSELRPSSEDWSLRGGTRSSGQTFQGQEQIVVSPTARWKATLSIPCFKRAQVLAMRRVLAYGRAQTWFVGPYEFGRAPWNVFSLGGKIVYGKGIEGGADTAAALSFALAVGTPLGSPQIQIARVKGGALEPGMMLSIGGRLHIITELAGETGTPGRQGPPNTLIFANIRPWLRVDHAAGDGIEFGSPVGTMRLASDDTGTMELQLSRYGTVTVDLVEAF